jgi:hypothetical protein
VRTAILLLTALALFAGHGRAAEAQTSYGIVCRGGPAMRLAPEVKAGASRVLLRFNRGSRAAVQGVDPGTCAWQDRGVRESEPAALCFVGVDYTGFETSGARQTPYLRVQARAGTGSVIFWEGGERPDGAAVQISSPDAQYYRAYNDPAGGCLRVTHVGT